MFDTLTLLVTLVPFESYAIYPGSTYSDPKFITILSPPANSIVYVLLFPSEETKNIITIKAIIPIAINIIGFKFIF